MSLLEDTLLFQLRATGLPEPLREYVFHPGRKWRFDLCWPEQHVAAECEGATWVQGRHTRGRGFEGDCQKGNQAALQGWLVLRFTSNMIESGEALTTIAAALGELAAAEE